jgi:uncharacterized coiled-coil protein SlyX
MSKTNDELDKEIKDLRERFVRVSNAQQRDISQLGGMVYQLQATVERMAKESVILNKRVKELRGDEEDDELTQE